MSGELSVLNCGKGDIRIKLDDSNPIDLAQAKRMITDMLRRGYLLAIEVDGKLEPVHSFDSEAGEYILIESVPIEVDDSTDQPVDKSVKPFKGKTTKKKVPMSSVKSIAVPMTSGG